MVNSSSVWPQWHKACKIIYQLKLVRKSFDTEDQAIDTMADYMSSKEAADEAIAAIEVVHFDEQDRPAASETRLWQLPKILQHTKDQILTLITSANIHLTCHRQTGPATALG